LRSATLPASVFSRIASEVGVLADSSWCHGFETCFGGGESLFGVSIECAGYGKPSESHKVSVEDTTAHKKRKHKTTPGISWIWLMGYSLN
jgi:hypothetical protein